MASPIAIVGISAEFPSGKAHDKNFDHNDFFNFLINKGEAYETIPSDRFNIESWKGPHAGQVLTDTGTFLKDVSLFDHLEFGITAADAKNMSLSTRKLIEHSFLALLDSGIDYRGRNVGCFTSGVSFDLTTITEPDEIDARGSFAGYPYMTANKVSYHLDLRGPSVPTDTACSSSLTALHLAVQSIRSGDCEAAVVGGCQLNYRLVDFIQYSQGGILSPDGKCKPFDSSANGFGRGEGVCAIVIKPLANAIRDGDPIYASILGTGINSSGGMAPVSAPVAVAQEDAMKRAYMNTGRQPSEVDFIELHATGTAVGDPTEANWVGKAFKREDGGELLIGSVKGNIGHLEITAFLASLSKVCSILRTGIVPPNVNFQDPNPSIKWDEYRLHVAQDAIKLQPRSPSGKYLISMTSSGIGGVNGHVVLESPPQRISVDASDASVDPILVCVGGLSPRSAADVVKDLQAVTQAGEFNEHTATVYGRRCRQMTWRTSTVHYPNNSSLPRFPDPVLVPRSKPPLVFVFSGQGPQHINMGRELYRKYSTFRQTVQELDIVHRKSTGYSLIEDIGLFDSSTAAYNFQEIWPIAITLPAICMLQIAVFDLFKSFGVNPDAVVGHSAGEAAVLYASGATSRELALEVSIARGIAMTQLEDSADGAMAAVNCSIEEAYAIRNEIYAQKEGPGVLDIGCHNSHLAYVFSGTRSLVEKAAELAKSREMFSRVIRTRIPVHSGIMELCYDKYQHLVSEAFERHTKTSLPFNSRLPTYSCLNGKCWTEPFTPDYIWQTARNPVLFSQAIHSILQDMPTASFLEISPHPVLTSYVSDMVGTKDNTVITSLKRAKKDGQSEELFAFLSALGKIVTLGYNISAISEVHGCHRPDFNIRVPAYPFAKKEVEFYSRSSNVISRQLTAGRRPLFDPQCELKLNALTHPDIAPHIIRGESIMPAAGYIEMAFEAGARKLWGIQFKSIMPIPRDSYLLVNLSRTGPYWKVTSRPSDQRLSSKQSAPRLHAEGYMSMSSPGNIPEHQASLQEIMDRCRKIKVSKFYENLQYFAGYGPVFQRIQSCHLNDLEALVSVKGCTDDVPNAYRYIIHPAILDASFHVMVSPSLTGNSDRFGYYLPSGVQTITLHNPKFFQTNRPQVIYSHVKQTSWEPNHIDYDLSLLDNQGMLICSMQGFRVARHKIEQNELRPGGFELLNVPVELSSLFNARIYLADHKFSKADPLIIPFKPDSILILQSAITELRRSKSGRLWIEATLGLEGFTAQGFVRSLSRELENLDIFLVLFHPVWGEHDRRQIIAGISNLEYAEQEIIVDADGVLRCPRIVPSIALGEVSHPTADDLWEWNENTNALHVSRSGRIFCIEGLLVQFKSITSVTAGGFRGFIGTVIQSDIADIPKGGIVAGITSTETLSNHTIVPEGHFIPVADREIPKELCDILLPAVIIRFALGTRLLRGCSRSTSYRIIYIESGTDIDRMVFRVFESLRMNVLNINSSSFYQLSSELGAKDIIISSITDQNEIQVIQKLNHGKAPVFLFNDTFAGIRRMVQADPWSIRDALEIIFPIFSTIGGELQTFSVDPLSLIPSTPLSVHRSLFNSSKGYLLIGGIGSLGLQVALWMYQNGARHLILTSRRGPSSLEEHKDLMAQRIMGYLKTRPELHIKLEACDATSGQQVTNLINATEVPLGGCLLMSVVLSDRLFMYHTQNTYYVPFAPKLGAFEALNRALDVKMLDFLVSFSSAAIFGNPGQTNYASSNTQLDGVLSRYPNAFSLVCPAIIDSITISHGDALTPDPRYQSWIPWAMSSRQICECLGDGIRKLARGSFTHYIPELDWNHVQRHFGKSPMYGSLVTDTDDSSGAISADSGKTQVVELVAKHLDLDIQDVALNVPLTSYGLDSLSAGRLAYALKPIVSVTQLQLLGDMTLEDLQVLVVTSETKRVDDEEMSAAVKRGFDWVDLCKPGETVVKLVEGDGNPLILIHGGSGNTVAFIPLQERFKTALWAIQNTPDAPRGSIRDTASHYCTKIKEARPAGPYRIGGYCASSLIAFEVVRILEQNGDRVEQFVVLDHLPSFFVSPLFPLDNESLETGNPSDALVEAAFLSLYGCYLRDSGSGRKKIMNELVNIHKGSNEQPASEYTHQYYAYFREAISAALKHILEIGGSEQRYMLSTVHLLQERLREWYSDISAPITLVLANRGFGAELLTDEEWQDYGARNFNPNVEVVRIPYGHFDMFENEELVNMLENS